MKSVSSSSTATAFLSLLLPSLAFAGFTTEACFELNGGPIVGALVKCWDDDYGWDDRVGPSGGVLTGDDGCASLYDNQWWWESPDVYCVIDPNGDCFPETTTPTKNNHKTRRKANFGTLQLSYDDDYCGDFGYDNNGCGTAFFPSWLRDTLTDVSGFENQCAAHDTCYGVCLKTRSECDSDFYDDMLATCAGQDNCEFLGFLYFQAVDQFGYDSCAASRGNCDQAGLVRCNQ